MSTLRVASFGETLRHLREENNMPLRKAAAFLDIDQSTLSKIERDERKANPDIILRISNLFKVNHKQLHAIFVSDNLAKELLDEENPNDILRIVENKIRHYKQKARNHDIKN
jgi:HTH-type transcriptional regulator, competence development regulator